MKAVFCLAAAYIAGSIILTGGLLRPIAFLTSWNSHLGQPHWQLYLVCAVILSCFMTVLAIRAGMPSFLGPAVLVFAAMFSSVIMVSWDVERQRMIETEKFRPDIVFLNSFFDSLHNAPKDFQFYLHGAALKNCKPYAWSYRTMTFYELPFNAAVNVLPEDWIKKCGIRRTPEFN